MRLAIETRQTLYRWLVLCACFVSMVPIGLDFVAVDAQSPETIQVRGLDPARVAAIRDAFENNLPYVPGELLVRFKPGAEPREQASALSILRTEVRRDQAAWIGDVLHLKGLEGIDPSRAAEDLQRQPEVMYAQPNYIRRPHATPTTQATRSNGSSGH